MSYPTAPDYDNVRIGGPDGIRYPLELGRSVFLVLPDSGIPNPLAVSLAVASQPAARVLDGELTLNYAGSTTVAGSVASVRGNTTIGSGTTITGASYIYGTQGKLTVKGTHSGSAEVSCGLLGQLDLSAAVGMTAPVAAIWGDCGATMSSGVTASDIDIAVLYNTTTKLIHSCLRIYADASYLFDITDASYGGAHFVVGTTASTAAGCLKVFVNGAIRYLQLYSGEA